MQRAKSTILILFNGKYVVCSNVSNSKWIEEIYGIESANESINFLYVCKTP